MSSFKEILIMKKSIFLFSLLFSVVSVFAGTNKSITDQLMEYSVFGKAFGIVRYYSPNPYTENWDEMDWAYVCYNLTTQLPQTDGSPEAMMQLLSPLAPNATITTQPQDSFNKPENTETYFYREHHGGGHIDIPKLAKILYKEYRNYKPFYNNMVQCVDGDENKPIAGMIYSYPIGEELYINIPIAEKNNVFDKKNTNNLLSESTKLWQSKLSSSGASARNDIISLVSEPEFRIADMIIRWNIIQHFYPYKEEDNLHWDNYLPEMIKQISSLELSGSHRKKLNEYRESILKLMNPVQDAHLIVWWDFYVQKKLGLTITYNYIPIMPTLVDNTIIVEAVAPDYLTGITKGCIIKSIDGRDASELLNEKVNLKNSSNIKQARYQALPLVFSSYKPDTKLTITYIDNSGGEHTEELLTTVSNPYFDSNANKDKKFITVTDDNIVIVNPCMYDKATYDEFAKQINIINLSRGVIFDLRGYPMLDFDKVLAHLSTKPLSNSFISTPITCFPNREKVQYTSTPETIEPLTPTITAPIVFLTNEKAMSWGETVIMLVKGYDLGKIVGSNTCGTNGDATTLALPVFGFRMTANKAVNVDGSQHHGIGVVPDIYIEPTLEGYLSGRDEVLEKGIEYLRNL